MTEAARVEAKPPDMRRVRALFDEAAAVQESARQELLDAAEPEVREAVAELLRMKHFIRCWTVSLVVPVPLAGLFAEGDCAGRYRIVREIGSGGMGTVYTGGRTGGWRIQPAKFGSLKVVVQVSHRMNWRGASRANRKF